MSEPLSIFNVGEHAAELNADMFAPKAQSNLFDPRVKQAGDELVFVVRPMPYVGDVKKSLVSKNFYALNDGNGTFFFDSMTTFNDRSTNHYEFCPVSDLWLKLNNSPAPAVKELAKNFRMQKANYCYVLVVAFPADPTFVGKMLPMRVPNELREFFNKLANPSEQDIALGAKAINPFDLYNGVNIKITAKGKMVNNQLMRDWVVEKHDNACPAVFPIGPNNTWLSVTQLQQDAVLKYFQEQQTEDLSQVYGYHTPSKEACKRMYKYMQAVVAGLPGLPEIIDKYFPEVVAELAAENVAEQALPAETQGAIDPMKHAIAGAQPAEQPAAPAPSGSAVGPGPGIVLP